MVDSAFCVFLPREPMPGQKLEVVDNPHRQAHNSDRFEEEGHKASLALALEPVGGTTRSLQATAAERVFDTTTMNLLMHKMLKK